MRASAGAGLTERERTLCAAVAARRAALLEDLRLHVGLPTGGRNAAALDETRERFCARLKALGASVTLHAGDTAPDWLWGIEPGAPPPPSAVCARLRAGAGAGGGPRVLLSGHLDTVHDPAGAFRELSVRPDGKTATGPGCVDMKGGLVIAVAALEVLEECGVACSWSFIFNSDEETGSYHSDRHLREQARGHDVGLVFEPALPDGSLVVERPGSGQFLIECRGRSAHTGRDFTKGVSAVTALAERLVAIGGMSEPGRGMIASVGPLSGNGAPNAVPEIARGWGNVRYQTPVIAEELGAKLDALGTDAGAMPSCRVVRSFNRPAKPLTPATQRLAELARGAAGDLGQGMAFGKTGGVCDGNNLQAEGLATIDTLGVRGGGLHTPEEWIELGSLVERCQLVAVLMSRLAEGRLAAQ